MSEFPPVSFEEFAVPTREQWYDEAVAALKGAPFDKRMFTPTYEGITLEPVSYTHLDVYKRQKEHHLLRLDRSLRRRHPRPVGAGAELPDGAALPRDI